MNMKHRRGIMSRNSRQKQYKLASFGSLALKKKICGLLAGFCQYCLFLTHYTIR
jgi:hypothetical protein